MESKEIEIFKDMLSSMLQEITKNGQATLDEMTENVEVYADPADRATAESERSFTLLLRDRERKLIKKITQALQRIEAGEYGACVDCGEDIGIARLKARPMTTLCINCKSNQEEDGLVQDE